MTRICGRATCNGSPCRHSLHWYEHACVSHATEAELADSSTLLRTDAHRRTCDCPCHRSIQPGLVPCPRCVR